MSFMFSCFLYIPFHSVRGELILSFEETVIVTAIALQGTVRAVMFNYTSDGKAWKTTGEYQCTALACILCLCGCVVLACGCSGQKIHI